MSILRLTIALEDVEPAVTRTLETPPDLRLDRLHLVLQAAMGWENAHLWEFAAGDARWGVPDPEFRDDAAPASKARLEDALAAAGSGPIAYLYDFGDSWRHRITAEPVDGPLPGHLYPRLTEARGRCPPEDVGGPPGYAHLLAVMADPSHADHDHLVSWAGGLFDPTVPETDELQLAVLKLAKRWKPRKQ